MYLYLKLITSSVLNALCINYNLFLLKRPCHVNIHLNKNTINAICDSFPVTNVTLRN